MCNNWGVSDSIRYINLCHTSMFRFLTISARSVYYYIEPLLSSKHSMYTYLIWYSVFPKIAAMLLLIIKSLTRSLLRVPRLWHPWFRYISESAASFNKHGALCNGSHHHLKCLQQEHPVSTLFESNKTSQWDKTLCDYRCSGLRFWGKYALVIGLTFTTASRNANGG